MSLCNLQSLFRISSGKTSWKQDNNTGENVRNCEKNVNVNGGKFSSFSTSPLLYLLVSCIFSLLISSCRCYVMYTVLDNCAETSYVLWCFITQGDYGGCIIICDYYRLWDYSLSMVFLSFRFCCLRSLLSFDVDLDGLE